MSLNTESATLPMGWRRIQRIDAVPPAMVTALAFVAFVLFWTLVNTISNGGAIDHDMTEAYVWGREFQLGYYKHPPFWAWLAGAWFDVLPHRAWAFAALSALNAGVGLLGAWRLIGCFSHGEKRVAAILLLLLTPYYTYFAYRYNANTIFLSLWPWTALFFVRSIERGRTVDAVLFGALSALDMLSKYYAILLLAACLLAACVHPRRRDYFRSALPYLSVALCAVVLVPHLWWLDKTGFLPFHYFEAQSGRAWLFGLRQAINGALEFAAFQIPIIVLIFLSRWRSAEITPVQWRESRFAFLTVLCFAPLVLTLASSVVFRVILTSGTGIGAFCLVPLFLIQVSGIGSFRQLERLIFWAVLATSGAVVLLAPLLGYAHVSHPSGMMRSIPNPDEPSVELAETATQLWHQKTGLPLRIVAGSIYHENPGAFYSDAYADMVAFYSDDRPSEFIDFDFQRAPWITKNRLEREGLLIVCPAGDLECLKTSAAFADPARDQVTLTLTHRVWHWQGARATFTLTFVPPRA